MPVLGVLRDRQAPLPSCPHRSDAAASPSVGCRRGSVLVFALAPDGIRGWLPMPRSRRRDGGRRCRTRKLWWGRTAKAESSTRCCTTRPSGVRWVQLPWAGIEPYVEVIRGRSHLDVRQGRLCRTGRRARTTLLLAGLRGLDRYACCVDVGQRPTARTCSAQRSSSSAGAGSPSRCFGSSSRSARM